MPIKDLYRILGLEKNAQEDEIRKAFRSLAQEYHPDKNLGLGDEEKHKKEEEFKNLEFAYSTLTNADRRKKYDEIFTPPSTESEEPHHNHSSRQQHSTENKNPFSFTDEYRQEMEELFGKEWFRMYSDEMNRAAESYNKNMTEINEMFKRTGVEAEETWKRIDKNVEEMLKKI